MMGNTGHSLIHRNLSPKKLISAKINAHGTATMIPHKTTVTSFALTKGKHGAPVYPKDS